MSYVGVLLFLLEVMTVTQGKGIHVDLHEMSYPKQRFSVDELPSIISAVGYHSQKYWITARRIFICLFFI